MSPTDLAALSDAELEALHQRIIAKKLMRLIAAALAKPAPK